MPCHVPTTPLNGYEILEVTISAQALACGRRLGEVRWPAGHSVLAASEGHKLIAPRADIKLRAGERVILLAPVATSPDDTRQGTLVSHR